MAEHGGAIPSDGAISYHGCSITPVQNIPWDAWTSAPQSRESRLSTSLGGEGLQLIHGVSTRMGRMCKPEGLLPQELFQMICKAEKHFSAPSPGSTLKSLLASPMFSCWQDQKCCGWYPAPPGVGGQFCQKVRLLYVQALSYMGKSTHQRARDKDELSSHASVCTLGISDVKTWLCTCSQPAPTTRELLPLPGLHMLKDFACPRERGHSCVPVPATSAKGPEQGYVRLFRAWKMWPAEIKMQVSPWMESIMAGCLAGHVTGTPEPKALEARTSVPPWGCSASELRAWGSLA